MTLTDARTRALQQKQHALEASLEAWLEATAGSDSRKDKAFEIHYLQTREVDQLMKGLRETTVTSLAKAVADGDLPRRGATIEETMLAACQVWEYFRGRFAQRLDPGLRMFLRVADELAWQCYRPIRDFALGGSPLCKAPPLVYLNSTWSPFTVVRGADYEAESVPRAFLRNVDFKTALSRLPFPVVAVPWYQTVYLPDTVSICHEVGHSIEADFGLQAQIDAAIAAAITDAGRAEVWKKRGSELFADYFACLAMGIAYPWALANILLATPDSMVTATDPKYPSPYARLLFNARLVEGMGFGAAATTFADAWQLWAAAAPADSVEIDDVRRIAVQFVGGAQPGEPEGIALKGHAGKHSTLRDVIGLTEPQQDEIDTEVEALGRGEAASSDDIRVLFGAAALMWRDAAFAAQPQLLTKMREACVDQRRNDEARLDAAVAGTRDTHLVDTGATVASSLLGAP